MKRNERKERKIKERKRKEIKRKAKKRKDKKKMQLTKGTKEQDVNSVCVLAVRFKGSGLHLGTLSKVFRSKETKISQGLGCR